MALVDIKVISFDADGTLFDFQRVMRLALGEVLAELQRQFPELAAHLSIDILIQHRNEAALSEHGSRAKMEHIRLEGFKRTLADIGIEDSRLAGELTERFLDCRFSKISVYADVVPALQTLREHFTLGILSNGNSYPERCGLGGWFAFGVYTHDHGYEKPDCRIFEVMVNKAGVDPSQILHVGDSLRNDVLGAQQAGIRTAWLRRNGEQRCEGVVPDIEVTSLYELVSVCL